MSWKNRYVVYMSKRMMEVLCESLVILEVGVWFVLLKMVGMMIDVVVKVRREVEVCVMVLLKNCFFWCRFLKKK